MINMTRWRWGSAALGLTLPLWALAQDSITVTGTSTSLFTAPEPNSAVVEGVDTNNFLWGEAIDSSAPSELEMDDADISVEVPTGVVFGPRLRNERPVFSLGKLRYFNGTILSGSEATDVRLETTVTLTTPEGTIPQLLEYPLQLINRPDNDDPVESADLVLFPDELPNALFEVPDGPTLTLERVGFGEIVGDGFVVEDEHADDSDEVEIPALGFTTFDGFFVEEEGEAETDVLARFAPICELIVEDAVDQAPPATLRPALSPAIAKSSSDDDDDFDRPGRKTTICHVPPGNPANAHTITVGNSAVDAHLDHGDYLGACDDDDLMEPEVEDPELIFVFVPNFGIAIDDALTLCGYLRFQWLNVVVFHPYPPQGVVVPFIDPNPILVDSDTLNFPFYWDVDGDANINIFNINNYLTINQFFFEDVPSEPQLQAGEYLRFMTFLVGVLPDGETFDVLNGSSWASNHTGDVEEATLRTVGEPLPGTGSGGVFEVSNNLNPEEIPPAVRQLLADNGARNVPTGELPDQDDFDRDGDGIDGAAEEDAPNFADGNGDGIDDIEQANVASYPTALGYVTVATETPPDEDACNLSDTTPLQEQDVANDPDFDYPLGLTRFGAECRNVTVTLFFHDLDSLDSFTFRGYGPQDPSDPDSSSVWSNFPANAGLTTVGNGTVPTITFQLSDGAFGDTSKANNSINSLALGIGIAPARAIPTLSGLAMIILTGLLGLIGWRVRHHG